MDTPGENVDGPCNVEVRLSRYLCLGRKRPFEAAEQMRARVESIAEPSTVRTSVIGAGAWPGNNIRMRGRHGG